MKSVGSISIRITGLTVIYFLSFLVVSAALLRIPSLAELSEIGVKRVSVGSALSRAALGAFLRAAHEMRDHGTFEFANRIVGSREISALFE